jgi:hypothetical protein
MVLMASKYDVEDILFLCRRRFEAEGSRDLFALLERIEEIGEDISSNGAKPVHITLGEDGYLTDDDLKEIPGEEERRRHLFDDLFDDLE